MIGDIVTVIVDRPLGSRHPKYRDTYYPYEPEDKVARQLYRSFGFVETGEMDGKELIAVLKL